MGSSVKKCRPSIDRCAAGLFSTGSICSDCTDLDERKEHFRQQSLTDRDRWTWGAAPGLTNKINN